MLPYRCFFPCYIWCARQIAKRLAPYWKRRLIEAEWLITFNEVNVLVQNQTWGPQNWYYFLENWEFGWLFQVLITNKFPRWWTKYTYSIYNATTIGNVLGALFLFFAAQYKHLVNPIWWGKEVFDNTADASDTTVRFGPLDLPTRGYFGPKKGCLPDQHGRTSKGC